jgi:hypothetical protein
MTYLLLKYDKNVVYSVNQLSKRIFDYRKDEQETTKLDDWLDIE